MEAAERKETFTGKELVVVQPVGVTLQLASTPVVPVPKTKPQKRVLDEDTYIEAVDMIIQRDFFPDLPTLRNQHEWLQAEATNDIEKMREIQARLRAQRTASIRATPSTFEPATPSVNPSFTPSQRGNGATGGYTPGTSVPQRSSSSSSQSTNGVLNTNMSLDEFQFTHTSEDNAAFDELLAKHNEQKRRKTAWMTDKEKETEQLLIEGRKDDQNQAAAPLMWGYKARNLLMYNADGVPFTDQEEQAMSARGPKQLLRENTRLQPQKNTLLSTTSVERSEDGGENKGVYNMLNAEELRMLRERKARDSKIDLDDLRATPGRVSIPQSPRVGGYGFVATPSPAPGVDASPIVTWGAVMGTPLRIDDTPIGAPQFKVSEMPNKDKLLLQLTEQVKARKKQSQNTAKVAVSSIVSPSPRSLRSSTPQRTPTSTGIDTQLRASYGKSPLSRAPHTPSHSISSLTNTPTHKSTGVFAKPAPRPFATATPTSSSSSASSSVSSSSITDNLLNI